MFKSIVFILALGGPSAMAAEAVIDGAKQAALFKCDGKDCSPVEASQNYSKYSLIVRCVPKIQQTPDGKDVSVCVGGFKPVFKHINPNTGATTWKTSR